MFREMPRPLQQVERKSEWRVEMESRTAGVPQLSTQVPLNFRYAVAGAGEPKPGLIFGGDGLITSGNGVAAWAPVGGPTLGVGSGGVNFPVRTISSTCAPSKVSYSSKQL